MRGYILSGTNEIGKKTFIDKFIQDNHIPAYNVVRFGETLKIRDVREIKKLLAITSSSNRLILIERATDEAQNALLKTLEELPQDATVIFENDQALLPTIVSRCTRVHFEGVAIVEVDPQHVANASKLASGNISESFALLDYFFSENTQASYDRLIISIRNSLASSFKNRPGNDIRKEISLLKALTTGRELIVLNNLNPRLTAEKIVLGGL